MDKLINITQKQHNQLVIKARWNLRNLKKLGYSQEEAFLICYDAIKGELERNYAIEG